jgi:hypothetical protein
LAAQYSVHPTGGHLRVFRQFAWLEVGSGKAVLPHPAQPPVTRAVKRVMIIIEYNKEYINDEKTSRNYPVSSLDDGLW